MTEVTLELFNTIYGADIDDNLQQMIFGWLMMLLKTPYLDDTEKKNVLNMLDYLETLGIEDFNPIYATLRTKLNFETPTPWDMELPDNYQVSIGNEILSLDDLRRRGIKYIDFAVTKPIRNSLEYNINRRLYDDGTVEIIPTYQVFSAPPIGERHLFHVYGEKAISNSDANN